MIGAFRAPGLPAAFREDLWLRQGARGYSEGTSIETLVSLLVACEECVDGARLLCVDRGLLRLWSRPGLPAVETLRAFLNRFYDAAAE